MFRFQVLVFLFSKPFCMPHSCLSNFMPSCLTTSITEFKRIFYFSTFISKYKTSAYPHYLTCFDKLFELYLDHYTYSDLLHYKIMKSKTCFFLKSRIKTCFSQNSLPQFEKRRQWDKYGGFILYLYVYVGM